MRTLIVLVGLAACYGPRDAERCSLSCEFAAGELCPGGQTCGPDNFCYEPGDEQVCDGVELVIETTGQGEVTGPDLRCSGTCTITRPKGSIQELIATPTEDGLLASWSLDGQPLMLCNEVGCVTDVDLTTTHKLTAQFEAGRTLSVTFIGDGPGDVALTGGGRQFTCAPTGVGSVCDRRFPPHTVIDVESAPRRPAVFAGYSGNCTPTATGCSVTLDDDLVISAQFDVTRIALLVVPEDQGAIGIGPTLQCPPDCTVLLEPPPSGNGGGAGIHPIAAPDHEFVRWIGCPADTFVCAGPFLSDTLLVALFEPQPTVEISMLSAGANIDVQVGSGPLSPCNNGQQCAFTRPTGTSFTLTVPPGQTATLMSWGNPICPNAGSPCTFTVDRSLTFNPSFSLTPVDS